MREHRPERALMRNTLFLLCLAAFSLARAQSVPASLVEYPDVIYTNARIITLDNHEMNDDPGNIVEAMAVRDEVIIALGSHAEIMDLSGPDTRVVDLKGRTVLPGIVESHVHPMSDSEAFAREKYNLRSTPEGYALRLDVAASPDATMARVAAAMEVLLANAKPGPEEWINISLVHMPELGFATPADVSTLMSSPRMSDVKISKADISEIVPDYPFVLTSATSIMEAPEKNIWYHITVGPDGEPITRRVVEFNQE